MADSRTLDALSRSPLRIEEVFGLTLNENQFKHYEGVRTFVGFPNALSRERIDAAREWLANSYCRGQGRTVLLAMCFLEWSVTQPGKRIDFFDHFSGRDGQTVMRKVLKEMVEKHPVFKAHVRFEQRDNAFTFTPFENN